MQLPLPPRPAASEASGNHHDIDLALRSFPTLRHHWTLQKSRGLTCFDSIFNQSSEIFNSPVTSDPSWFFEWYFKKNIWDPKMLGIPSGYTFVLASQASPKPQKLPKLNGRFTYFNAWVHHHEDCHFWNVWNPSRGFRGKSLDVLAWFRGWNPKWTSQKSPKKITAQSCPRRSRKSKRS